MLDRVLPPERLPELLAEADFVVLAAPLTVDTRGLIGEAAIAAMKPGAWVINVARGELVDERALGRALRAGRLGGAVLDTFLEEPLPPTSPLYDLPNVILTPHTSWSSTRVLERSVELFCGNLRRFAEGRPLVNVVDPDAGY
jgi:phosphoglycerate dehydrogenase-like enzyme